MAASIALAGCSADQPTRLASRCARAAPELRVQHLASLMTSADITVTDTRIDVVAEVPVGIGIDAKPKFRLLHYTCTRDRDGLRFDTWRVTTPER